jgi:hypothetical protein
MSTCKVVFLAAIAILGVTVSADAWAASTVAHRGAAIGGAIAVSQPWYGYGGYGYGPGYYGYAPEYSTYSYDYGYGYGPGPGPGYYGPNSAYASPYGYGGYGYGICNYVGGPKVGNWDCR